MPDVLYPPIAPPRYIATRDYRGYCYCLDTTNGLAVCCGSPDFTCPTSEELASKVADRLNDGSRDPGVYEWYPMTVNVGVEPRKPSAWSVASAVASVVPSLAPASPAPCYAEAAL